MTATPAPGPTTDDRWRELGRTIADGTQVGAGDRVMVALTDVDAVEAAEALVAVCHARGAHPQVQLVDERFDRAALLHAPLEELGRTPELEAHGMDWADVYVAVRGMVPPDPVQAEVPVERTTALRAAKGRISTLRWQQTRWCIVRVPTPAWAEYSGADHGELLDELFAGCIQPWADHRAAWDRLCAHLDTVDDVRITAPGTDLAFSLAGRRWITFAGEQNLPDGEVATAPVEDTVTGTLVVPGPAVFAGRRVAGVELGWEGGELVHVEADEGADLVRALTATDDGASRIGEFGIGVNPDLTRMTQDLFFDEKVLGTVHVALGRAYPQCGGTNQSQLHWDLVVDLRPDGSRPGGDVHVDGRPLVDRGQPRWGELWPDLA